MRGSLRRSVALAAVLALGATAGVIAAPQPAFAADGDVTLVKTASVSEVAPGQSFAYPISISCSSVLAGCINATLTDTVPTEFELLGATIGTGLQGVVTITGQRVDVVFTHPIGANQGLPAGIAGVVTINVRARADLPYEANGVPVTNTATTDADTQTSGPLSSSAAVTPVVPLALAASASKILDPETALASPGTPVTATVTAGNTSNAGVDALVITDPAAPAATPNPFETLPFTGFGAVTFPTGADQVQVDIWDGDEWVEGAPGPVAHVPAGEVLGLRLTFSNAAGGTIPAGASTSVQLGLEHGPAVTTITGSQVVTDTASAEVVLDGDTASATASDDHTIIAEEIVVAAGKVFSPDQVAAGEPSTATLTAANNSAFALTGLTVTEPSVVGGDPFAPGFDDAAVFTGFTAGVPWPSGTTAASVTYYLDDATTQTVPFASGSIPPPPTGSAAVVRFRITFTGQIASGATTQVPVGIATDHDETAYPATITDEVTVGGTGPSGGTLTTTAQDDLLVYGEHLEMTTTKSLYPDTVLDRPGEWVVVTMNGQVSPFPASTTDADTIVVQDPPSVPVPIDGTFWDGFNATEISDTAVPANANLTIDYWDGANWIPLAGPISGPTVYSSDIPAALQDTIEGLRFTFTAKAGESFPPGTTVEPHVIAETRATERVPVPATTAPSSVENCAISSASTGALASTPTPGATACDSVGLIDPTGGGAGIDVLDKTFDDLELTSRSQQQLTATLNWSTGGFSGVDEVVIGDTANALPVEDSFFNAFDLVAVPAISSTMDPLLQYDQVEAVELFDGTDWRALANDPCPCVGAFPGVTLTDADRGAAIGVRLRISEAPGRASADPTAPPAGSGVARSSGNTRQVQLVFELRDVVRVPAVPPTPAMGTLDYNVDDGDPTVGTVQNTSVLTGTDAGGTPVIGSEDAEIVRIIDVPLNVSISKTWSGSPFGVPPITALDQNFPTGRVRLEATNETAAKIDSLTITDPTAGNPFEYFNLFDIRIASAPPGAVSSAVTLSRDTDGDGAGDTLETLSASAAEALATADLLNVVGITVQHTGRINAGAQAVLEFDLQLRKFERSTPSSRVGVTDSPISNTAEVVITDAGGGVAGANTTSDSAAADATLESIDLEVSAGKSFSPASQLEPDDSPITMTLSGQPGGSGRAAVLVLTDDDPTFWNAFDFVGPAPGFTLATPIDRVQLDVFTGAGWQLGTARTLADFLATPLPPGVAPGDVQGVRFTFTRADQTQWENPTNPLQPVPLLVQRRTELRTGGEVPSDRADLDPAPGESAAGQVQNDLGVSASSFLGAGAVTVFDDATADYNFLHAESSVTVAKGPAGFQNPGEAVPYTLSVSNDGDWPIVNPVIVDTLPSDAHGPLLVFNPAPPPGDPGPYSYSLTGTAPSPASGPPLPTDTVDVAETATPTQLTFTFPAGSVLEVGQTYVITVELFFRIGLPGGTTVTNEVSVSGDRPLDSCNGVTATVDSCEADTTVTVLAAGAARSGKYVRALDPSLGAFPAIGTTPCSPLVDGFYAPPCTPIVKPGGYVAWRLAIVNTGNIPMDRLILMDRLPTVGDTALLTGAPRNSAWDPVFAAQASLALAPPGSSFTFGYTTTSNPCTDDLEAAGTPCTAGEWTFTDPATVVGNPDITAIQFVVALGSPLVPNGRVYLDYLTTAPAVSPTAGSNTIAWNTVATGAHLTADSETTGAPALIPIEGTKIGAALATGPLTIVKTISPAGYPFAPTSFDLQLSCVSAGETLPPIDVTLEPGVPLTVEDLPWGAECTLLEGDYGQVSSSAITGTVPGDASLENRYDYASLSLTKQVESDAVDQDGVPVDYGPFEARVDCTFLGEPVLADGYTVSPMAVPLAVGGTTTLTGLPANAECTVTEPDAMDAVTTTVTGSTSAGPSGFPLTLTPDTVFGQPTNAATITNTFESGALTITKEIDGPGAADFGFGPFTVHISCVLSDATGSRNVWDGDVVLDGPTPIVESITSIAAGAVCEVTEVDNGVADSTSISPASVTIDGTTAVGVTVTNLYLTGSLAVQKVVTGDGADLYGAGPFTVRVACVDLDGGPSIVDIPGGADRELSEDNDYATLYETLPNGAFCRLVETDSAGATTSSVKDENGDPIGLFRVGDGVIREFTVVNNFAVGSIDVTKTVTGEAASAHAADQFVVELSCGTIPIPGGAQRTLTVETPVIYDDLPAGTECRVTELAPTADEVTFSPSATVLVAPDTTVDIGINNRYDPLLAAAGNLGVQAIAALAVLLLVAGFGVRAASGRPRRK